MLEIGFLILGVGPFAFRGEEGSPLWDSLWPCHRFPGQLPSGGRVAEMLASSEMRVCPG